MPEKKVTVCNELGLHARAAAAFVRISNKFECDIFVACRDAEVDGKSIMGVMMLAATKGSDLTIRAEGPDSGPAIQELAELVINRFGEER